MLCLNSHEKPVKSHAPMKTFGKPMDLFSWVIHENIILISAFHTYEKYELQLFIGISQDHGISMVIARRIVHQ